jgi:hypothetical protein
LTAARSGRPPPRRGGALTVEGRRLATLRTEAFEQIDQVDHKGLKPMPRCADQSPGFAKCALRGRH